MGLDAFYCQPGITGAHEKGGVEGQIGWFRRNHLVPVPDVPSVRALNAMIDQWDAADEAGGPPAQDAGPAALPAVASLTARRLGKLPPDSRPLPSVAAYDQLLRRNRTAQEGTATP